MLLLMLSLLSRFFVAPADVAVVDIVFVNAVHDVAAVAHSAFNRHGRFRGHRTGSVHPGLDKSSANNEVFSRIKPKRNWQYKQKHWVGIILLEWAADIGKGEPKWSNVKGLFQS